MINNLEEFDEQDIRLGEKYVSINIEEYNSYDKLVQYVEQSLASLIKINNQWTQFMGLFEKMQDVFEKDFLKPTINELTNVSNQ